MSDQISTFMFSIVRVRELVLREPRALLWCTEGSDRGGFGAVTRVRSVISLLLLASVAGASTASAGSRDEWNPLRRPLHLPKLAAGATCPVSPVDPRVREGRTSDGGGIFIGRGPVYPGLGDNSGLLWATRYGFSGSPWFGEKVFWYVLPSYRGPVLIRGRRLDGSQMMGFNGRKRPARELPIKPNQSVSWQGQPRGSRGVPSDVRVLKPGCYGLQIDGTSFSRIVVISV